jgi:hypothetical protein
MTLIRVKSSAIRAIGYDGDTLGVQFHSSDIIYEHPGVPATLYARFVFAESKGTFYADHIRGKYQQVSA